MRCEPCKTAFHRKALLRDTPKAGRSRTCASCGMGFEYGRRGPVQTHCTVCSDKQRYRLYKKPRACPQCGATLSVGAHRCYPCTRAKRREAAKRRPRPTRSAEAEAYRVLYRSKRWRLLREGQLAAEPECRMCKAQGVEMPATVCDHVIPHRGDETLFWSGPFQSLCARHHSSDKQREERALAA
jgi:5-methylcytosine-specific restriction enzyme A